MENGISKIEQDTNSTLPPTLNSLLSAAVFGNIPPCFSFHSEAQCRRMMAKGMWLWTKVSVVSKSKLDANLNTDDQDDNEREGWWNIVGGDESEVMMMSHRLWWRVIGYDWSWWQKENMSRMLSGRERGTFCISCALFLQVSLLCSVQVREKKWWWWW